MAYCSVTSISLLGFCLGKKFGGEKTQFWARVWMFPVLTFLFTLAMIFSFGYRHGDIAFPVQLTVALLGYTWFTISLAILLSRKFSCFCGKKTHSSISSDAKNIQTRSDCEENIYENDQHFQKPHDLI